MFGVFSRVLALLVFDPRRPPALNYAALFVGRWSDGIRETLLFFHSKAGKRQSDSKLRSGKRRRRKKIPANSAVRTVPTSSTIGPRVALPKAVSQAPPLSKIHPTASGVPLTGAPQKQKVKEKKERTALETHCRWRDYRQQTSSRDRRTQRSSLIRGRRPPPPYTANLLHAVPRRRRTPGLKLYSRPTRLLSLGRR